ncbi:MAG: aldo/keto reductase [Acidimicrobiia bacterium]|nr:aldo/keto reductase [Acidimicrobiia bacterium]
MRQLGKTGFVVSRLGLGLAALGRPAYINVGHHSDLAGHRDIAGLSLHTHHILDLALEHGVRYFDAARSYGKAEEFLASWIDGQEGTLHDVVVGSKWGYSYVADWDDDAVVHEVKSHDLVTLDRQIHESLQLLHDNLDIYQIHSATEDSGVLRSADVLLRLGELRDEGLTIGLTTSGPDQAVTIRHALEVEVGGSPLFGTIQATWNVLEPSAGAALAEAHDAGVGVIVKEALANGRLTHPDSRAAMSLQHAIHDVPRDAAALAAALAQPWADVVLSGAATEDQLRDNTAAFDVEVPDLSHLVEPSEEYWTRRSMLDWN